MTPLACMTIRMNRIKTDRAISVTTAIQVVQVIRVQKETKVLVVVI